jgi:FkbM family methyltransferase
MKLRYRIADALGYRLVKKKNDHSHVESHVPKLLESLGINCVVDAGANLGQFAGMLRRCGYTGRIVSFEPVPAAYDKLERRAKSDADWFTHRLALGSADESRFIHVYDASELSSLLPTSEYGRAAIKRKADDVVRQEVSVRRLDGLWPRVAGDLPEPRVFLKMDTQGYDLEVFDGARGCIEVVRGLQSELSVLPLYEGMPDFATSLERYRSCGFEVSGFFPVFRDKQTHLLGEFDCVMIRPPPDSAAATRR